jgi:hypothetical protein
MISAERIHKLQQEKLTILFPKLIALNRILDQSIGGPEDSELKINQNDLELAILLADLIASKKASERLAYYEYLGGRIKFFSFAERFEEAGEFKRCREYYKHCFLKDLKGYI